MENQQQPAAVFYLLYNATNSSRPVAEGLVEIGALSYVGKLQELVYLKHRAKLQTGADPSDLQVYTPGTTDFTNTSPLQIDTTVQQLLRHHAPTARVVVVVRQPSPATPPTGIPRVDVIVNVQWHHRSAESAAGSTTDSVSMPMTLSVEKGCTVSSLKDALLLQFASITTVSSD